MDRKKNDQDAPTICQYCQYCGKPKNLKFSKRQWADHFLVCSKRDSAYYFYSSIKGVHRPLKRDRPVYVNCSLCNRTLKTKKSLDAHVRLLHKNAGNFKCSRLGCDQRFGSRIELDYHENKHTQLDFLEKKACGCEICSKRFLSKKHLDAHHQNIHAEKKFKCDLCDKAFGRKAALKQHLAFVHSNNKKPSERVECKKGQQKGRKEPVEDEKSAMKNEQLTMKDEQPGRNNSSVSAAYSLRAMGKELNYKAGQGSSEDDEMVSSSEESESDDYVPDSDEESNEESDEESIATKGLKIRDPPRTMTIITDEFRTSLFN